MIEYMIKSENKKKNKKTRIKAMNSKNTDNK
jgi:hypothetical protein